MSPPRDLADLNNDGRLTRDGFAVAMHLIQGKLAGKDIPTNLPASLIPPSMRSSALANGISSPFVPPQPPQQPHSELRDLIWDGTPPPSATQTQTQMPHQHATMQPQQTGTFTPQMTGGPMSQFQQPMQQQPPPQDPFGNYLSYLKVFFVKGSLTPIL